MRKWLRDRKGELHLDSLLSVFVLFLCLSIALAVLPAVVKKQQLDVLCKETARLIEVTGEIPSNLDTEIHTMGARIGVVPDRYSTTPASGTIQLRNEFTVTMEIKVDIGYGWGVSVPVTLTSEATGRSEVYHKI